MRGVSGLGLSPDLASLRTKRINVTASAKGQYPDSRREIETEGFGKVRVDISNDPTMSVSNNACRSNSVLLYFLIDRTDR